MTLLCKDGTPDGRSWRKKYGSAREASQAYYQRAKAAGTLWVKELFRDHGITPEQFDAVAKSQDYGCAICGGFATPGKNGAWRELSVDHDHRCCPAGGGCAKCFRGLLCDKCNQLLGLADDSVGTLLSAVAYLRQWESKCQKA